MLTGIVVTERFEYIKETHVVVMKLRFNVGGFFPFCPFQVVTRVVVRLCRLALSSEPQPLHRFRARLYTDYRADFMDPPSAGVEECWYTRG